MTSAEIAWLLVVVYWITGSILTGYVATLKGRSGVAWGWGAALVLSPLLALIALASIPERRDGGEQ